MTRLLGNEPYFPRDIVLKRGMPSGSLPRTTMAPCEGEGTGDLRVGDGLDELHRARGQAEAHPFVGLYYRSHCARGVRNRGLNSCDLRQRRRATLSEILSSLGFLRFATPPNFFTCWSPGVVPQLCNRTPLSTSSLLPHASSLLHYAASTLPVSSRCLDTCGSFPSHTIRYFIQFLIKALALMAMVMGDGYSNLISLPC